MRLRFTEGWEVAAESLVRAEGLETAAAYELDLITAGEAAAQQGSGSSAAVATASSGTGACSVTSDAAAVVATALDATACAATSDAAAVVAAASEAGPIAFERVASALASASSFWMNRVPSTSTALTGPVRPWTVMRLALGWVHASANVRGLVTASAGMALSIRVDGDETSIPSDLKIWSTVGP